MTIKYTSKDRPMYELYAGDKRISRTYSLQKAKENAIAYRNKYQKRKMPIDILKWVGTID